MLLGWLLSALWESLVVFYTSAWALSAATDRSGVLLGLWSSGTLAYCLVATIVSLLPPLSLTPLWQRVLLFQITRGNPLSREAKAPAIALRVCERSCDIFGPAAASDGQQHGSQCSCATFCSIML